MRYIKAAFIGLSLGILVPLLFSCAGPRLIPHYNGADPQLEPYVEEYKALAKYHGITFNNSVSMGFTDINQGYVVGLTNYGLFFREIDIDRVYWSNATDMTRLTLMFHEMTHSFCFRSHDYGEGKEYDKNSFSMDGRFNDACPKSLMFPYELDDDCAMAHYQQYIDEMFERCIPF